MAGGYSFPGNPPGPAQIALGSRRPEAYNDCTLQWVGAYNNRGPIMTRVLHVVWRTDFASRVAVIALGPMGDVMTRSLVT